MRKQLSFLLACLLLSSCSVANSSEETDASTGTVLTTDVGTEEEEVAPDLPDVTYDGADFRVVLLPETDGYISLWRK